MLLSLIILFTLASPLSKANEQSVLIFNRPADTPQANYVIELMTIVYNKLGYKMHIIDFNHQSALAAANNGVLDGQLARIANIESNYPNLQRVEKAVFNFNLVLLKNCNHCSYQQLKSLAIQSSYPAAQSYIKEHPFQGELIKVRSVTTQINLLMQGKVDGTLLLDFLLTTKHPQFNANNYQQETLKAMNGYHFLHKRHHKLLPKITQILNDLEKDGTIRLLKAKHGLL